MQPATCTSQDACRPRSSTDSTTAASSSGGSVLGMQITAVHPPSAAARAPVSRFSASSRPGSRKCTWMSTRPGATMHPSASSTSAPAPGASPAPTSATVPSTTRTSATRSPLSSSTRPPWMTSSDNGTSRSEQRPEHGHAHRHTVGDLLGHERPGGVGDVGRDLDAPVHRSGMHHERVGLQPRRARRGEPPPRRVLADRREPRRRRCARSGCAAGTRRRRREARRRGRTTP